MSITKNNVLRHELIGLNVRILESKNKCNLEIKGEIVDETYHTIQIRTTEKIKRLMKKNQVFEVTLASGERIKIDGKNIEKRPWDRLKIKE